MNTINISELTLEQLKALAYDLLLRYEQVDKSLRTVQEAIKTREKELLKNNETTSE